MPEWLIIVVVFFIVTRIVRSRRHRLGRHGYPHHLRHARMHQIRARREARAADRDRRSLRASPPTETPEEALKRKYVEGSITVEEYERQLDRLYRKDPPPGPG